MEKIRCPICNRWLMSGQVVYVETKCPKCNNVIRLYGVAAVQEIKLKMQKQS